MNNDIIIHDFMSFSNKYIWKGRMTSVQTLSFFSFLFDHAKPIWAQGYSNFCTIKYNFLIIEPLFKLGSIYIALWSKCAKFQNCWSSQTMTESLLYILLRKHLNSMLTSVFQILSQNWRILRCIYCLYWHYLEKMDQNWQRGYFCLFLRVMGVP